MRTQLIPKDRVEPSVSVAEGVGASVQNLINVVTDLQIPPASEANSDGQTVILDVEVDDVRCILIRLPPNSSRIPVMLSPREQEIVRMVAQGYPNKTIAAVLDISSWTVGTHLRRIFAKLGVGSRAAMVARLLERGSIGDQPRPQIRPRSK
jgi:DNA-binding CsgD family transcriptional regulator